MSSTSTAILTAVLIDRSPDISSLIPDDQEVEVWFCDINGEKWPIKMPITARFVDVMQKAYQVYGYIPNNIIGYKGGKEAGGWNGSTTIAETLPHPIPTAFNVNAYLRDHPIQPKYKVRVI